MLYRSLYSNQLYYYVILSTSFNSVSSITSMRSSQLLILVKLVSAYSFSFYTTAEESSEPCEILTWEDEVSGRTMTTVFTLEDFDDLERYEWDPDFVADEVMQTRCQLAASHGNKVGYGYTMNMDEEKIEPVNNNSIPVLVLLTMCSFFFMLLLLLKVLIN